MPSEYTAKTVVPPPVPARVRVASYTARPASRRAKDHPSFWDDIHPGVLRRARPAYEAGDCAAAVREAVDAVHTVVQQRVKLASGIELHGDMLMRRTFAPAAPIIALDDVATKSGRDTQQGFMQLFAGSILGLANSAIGNCMTPDARQTRHIIYLASLLLHKLDEREAL